MNNTPIRIVIADDHPFFREGFKSMLQKQALEEVVILGEAENGCELLKLCEEHNPDIVVTDIKMPVMDGLEVTKILVKKYPGVKIIAMSMFDDDSIILDMLDAGVKGYLLKNAHKDEVIQAIKAVNYGGNYFSNTTSKKLISLIASSHHNPYTKSKPKKFNDHELVIIKMICKQKTNKEIADELHLSVRTIEDYRRGIQEKIDARNAVGIAFYAMKHGIVLLKDY